MKNLLTILLMAFTMVAMANHGDGYRIGDKVTDFSLKNVDGKMVSLADFNAKGYIVIFTCNHCPYAVMYEDRIKAINAKYADKGYPVVAINPNDPDVSPGDSFEGMKTRAADKGFDFPYLFDEGQKVFPQFGATKTPHVFLLDKDMVVRYIGAIDDNPQDADAVEVGFLENAIDAVENGRTVDPATTKAIGCTIKVKKK
jgi:peroxiredoxin